MVIRKSLGLIAAMLLLISVSVAHEGTPSASAKAVTMTGQIVDPACLINHNSSGPGHQGCAMACAKAGINMAFYNEADHQLYMIFPNGHSNPNDKVMDYLEKRVEITGIVHKSHGYQGVEIQSLKDLGEGKEISLK